MSRFKIRNSDAQQVIEVCRLAVAEAMQCDIMGNYSAEKSWEHVAKTFAHLMDDYRGYEREYFQRKVSEVPHE